MQLQYCGNECATAGHDAHLAELAAIRAHETSQLTEYERRLAVHALREQAKRDVRDSRSRTYGGEAGKPYRESMRRHARDCMALADRLCREVEQ